MKFIPPQGSRRLETLPPMLRAHLTAEMDYAEAMLAPRARHYRAPEKRCPAEIRLDVLATLALDRGDQGSASEDVVVCRAFFLSVGS